MKFMLSNKAIHKKIIKKPVLNVYKQRQTYIIKSQFFITNIKDPWFCKFLEIYLKFLPKIWLFLRQFFR